MGELILKLDQLGQPSLFGLTSNQPTNAGWQHSQVYEQIAHLTVFSIELMRGIQAPR